MDRLEASEATQPAHARTPPRLHARLGRGAREAPTRLGEMCHYKSVRPSQGDRLTWLSDTLPKRWPANYSSASHSVGNWKR